MTDLIADAIKCVLCLVVVVTLAPLSQTLRAEGAADWFAMIFLVVAGVAMIGAGYWAWRVARKA